MIKKINWKSGVGTSILGMFMIVACFYLILTTIDYASLFNETIRTQTIVDTIADGATVYAQTFMGIDEIKLNDKAKELVDENNKNRQSIQYSIDSLRVITDGGRVNFNDKKVTLEITGKSGLVIRNNSSNPYFTVTKKASVLAAAQVPNNSQLTERDTDILAAALATLPSDSVQARALIESTKFYGWRYSQSNRWADGARDCSSFILSCFRQFTDIFNINYSGYTVTLWDDCQRAGYLHTYNAEINTLNDLQVGDIIFHRGNWGASIGRPRDLSHVSIYLGVDPTTGIPMMMDSGSSAGGVTIRKLFGHNGGLNAIIAYARIPYDTLT